MKTLFAFFLGIVLCSPVLAEPHYTVILHCDRPLWVIQSSEEGVFYFDPDSGLWFDQEKEHISPREMELGKVIELSYCPETGSWL